MTSLFEKKITEGLNKRVDEKIKNLASGIVKIGYDSPDKLDSIFNYTLDATKEDIDKELQKFRNSPESATKNVMEPLIEMLRTVPHTHRVIFKTKLTDAVKAEQIALSAQASTSLAGTNQGINNIMKEDGISTDVLKNAASYLNSYDELLANIKPMNGSYGEQELSRDLNNLVHNVTTKLPTVLQEDFVNKTAALLDNTIKHIDDTMIKLTYIVKDPHLPMLVRQNAAAYLKSFDEITDTKLLNHPQEHLLDPKDLGYAIDRLTLPMRKSFIETAIKHLNMTNEEIDSNLVALGKEEVDSPVKIAGEFWFKALKQLPVSERTAFLEKALYEVRHEERDGYLEYLKHHPVDGSDAGKTEITDDTERSAVIEDIKLKFAKIGQELHVKGSEVEHLTELVKQFNSNAHIDSLKMVDELFFSVLNASREDHDIQPSYHDAGHQTHDTQQDPDDVGTCDINGNTTDHSGVESL